MDGCQVEGCPRPVSKPGHAFCLEHWKAQRNGSVTRCEQCGRWRAGDGPLCRACDSASAPPSAPAAIGEEDLAAGDLLSSTRIGRHLGLSSQKTNLVLAELGWIERYVKGWVPTDRGNALGANVRELRNGTPYVVWPVSILSHVALRKSVGELAASLPAATESPAAAAREPTDAHAPELDHFRDKFPAKIVTMDGHRVRSRAELVIDNWLYMQEIVHAYERRLPIEEDCYCDFYLPAGNLYIEFWGRTSDPAYRDRMATKQAIYAKHGLRLIELGDAEIDRLDDVLPRLLLRFGIESV